MFVCPNRETSLLEAYELLDGIYRLKLADEEYLTPFEFLIFAILSQRTRNADASLAYYNLRLQFPDWEEIRLVPLKEIEHAILSSTWPDEKAKRIQRAIEAVRSFRGGYMDLDNLYLLSTWEAGAWIERLPYVQRKTAWCVLLMSALRRPVLPVDTGYRRFAIRFGVLSPSTSWNDAHYVLQAQLPKSWDAQQIELHHNTIKKLTQTCCGAQPACYACPLRNLCAYGNRDGQDDQPSPTPPKNTWSSFQPLPGQMSLNFN